MKRAEAVEADRIVRDAWRASEITAAQYALIQSRFAEAVEVDEADDVDDEAEPRRWVRIDRADGSRTFRVGRSCSAAEADREADAWRDSFPIYRVDVLTETAEVRDEVGRWVRATRDGSRYYPREVDERAAEAARAADRVDGLDYLRRADRRV